MNVQKIKSTLDQAEEHFNTAQEELSRPHEDVVPYMVCRNAFKAVNKYLTGYLLDNGKDIHASESLAVLLENCRNIDPKFKELNLDPMYSTKEDEDVWMDMNAAKEFMDLARRTKTLVG